MLIYIILLIIAMIFCLNYSFTCVHNLYYELLWYLLCIPFVFTLIVIYIFRGTTVGTDYAMYNLFLQRTPEYLTSIGIEKGFVWLYTIAENKQMPLLVTIVAFIIMNGGLYIFARQKKIKFPLYISMLVLTYLYFIMFNMIRQMTAIGIVFAALSMFLDDDLKWDSQCFWIRYVVYVVIIYFFALNFHTSALVSVILPFCKFINVTRAKILLGMLITAVGIFTNIGNIIIPKIIHFFPHYVEKYTNSMDFFYTGSKSIVAVIPIFILFFILFLIVSYDQEFLNNNRLLLGLFFVYLILFSASSNQVLTRIQYYWLPAMPFFFTVYLTDSKANVAKLSSRTFKLVIILFFFMYSILRLLANNSGVVPYYLR